MTDLVVQPSRRWHARRGIPVLLPLAITVVAIVVLCAAVPDLLAPYSPSKQDLLLGDTPPGPDHILGTDTLGRDVFSRLIHGARTALIGPLLIAFGGFGLGLLLGLPAGYLGGRVDSVVMRWVDIMYSLPSLLIAIVIVGIVGGGYALAVGLMIILFSPAAVRIVRSEALRQRSLPYVEAARTLGFSRLAIMTRHIAPNTFPVLASYVFLDFGFALVALSGLSFLGIGVPPGSPEWGRTLFENRNLLFSNPVASLAPGIAIVVTAASMNMIGDWVYERVASGGATRL